METSQLIKQVKQRPAIWNPARKENKKMAAAWKQICRMAWPDFDTRSDDEKRAKCNILQKKWIGIQQSFRRDYLRQKSGKERGVEKSQYYNQLSFLIPIIDNTSSNSGSNNGPTATSTETVTSSTPQTAATPLSQESDAEEDRQFLLSLVSFMQDVPRSKKLALRSELLQVIAKYSGGAAPDVAEPYRQPALSQEY